jgi:endonuclease-3
MAAEKQLVNNIEKMYIYKAHHWLILHGRYICTARNPKCSECGIRHACKFYNKNKTLKYK